MAKCCTLFDLRHSRRNSHAPWANGLVEVQNKIVGTHLRMFLRNTPKNWFIPVPFSGYAHKTKPLPRLHISSYEKVFHKPPRISLIFQLNLSQNSIRECIAQWCSELSPHSY